MKKISNVLFLSLLIFWACGGGTSNQSENEIVPQDILLPLEETMKTKIGQIKYDGELVNGKYWNDKNGENILLFTRTMEEVTEGVEMPFTNVTLRVYHYADAGNGFNLISEISDSENECDRDNRAKFIIKSITVTDIDKNAYAEVVFAYRLGCTSELSPDGLKLYLTENGHKYGINGNTLVDYGTEKVGGETNIDAEFEKAPREFLEHAKKIWENEQDHNSLVEE
jgi:hypothetical protein